MGEEFLSKRQGQIEAFRGATKPALKQQIAVETLQMAV